MIEVETCADLAAHAGEVLGVSHWVEIDQHAIDAFADITGDDQWIHVDAERAAQEMPGGKTIAHGLMLVSLIPRLQREIYAIRNRGRGLNYGYDRIRFISPVPASSRVRLEMKLEGVEDHPQGSRIVTEQTIVIEGQEKPAVVARHIVLVMHE